MTHKHEFKSWCAQAIHDYFENILFFTKQKLSSQPLWKHVMISKCINIFETCVEGSTKKSCKLDAAGTRRIHFVSKNDQSSTLIYESPDRFETQTSSKCWFFPYSFPAAGSIHRPTLIQFGPLHRTSFTGEDRTEFHLVHHTKKKGRGPSSTFRGSRKVIYGAHQRFQNDLSKSSGGALGPFLPESRVGHALFLDFCAKRPVIGARKIGILSPPSYVFIITFVGADMTAWRVRCLWVFWLLDLYE